MLQSRDAKSQISVYNDKHFILFLQKVVHVVKRDLVFL